MFFININSQNIYPLETYYEDVPEYSYMKDLNNELDPYVGEYMAMDNGKTIELRIIKIPKHPGFSINREYFKDVLRVKILVRNSTGQKIYENLLEHDDIFHSIALTPSRDTVVFSYSGTNCAVGWGEVKLKKLNSTEIQWNYRPFHARTEKCPNADLTLYLPQTKDLIFTKQ